MYGRNEFKCEAADPAADRLASVVQLHRHGAALLATGDLPAAAGVWVQARGRCDDDTPPRLHAALLLDLGRLRLAQGMPEAAAPVLDEAIALLRMVTDGVRDLAAALAARAGAHGAAGTPDAALPLLWEAAALLERQVQATRSTVDAVPLAHALLEIGRHQMRAGEAEAARDALARARDVTLALLSADPSQDSRNLRNAALNHLGRAEEALGRHAHALPLYAESAADMRRLVQIEGRADLADDLARAEADLARLRRLSPGA